MSAQLPVGKVIAHVDLDAFYAVVEECRDPERLAGKPVGVLQYNPYGDLRTLTLDDDRLMPTSNGSLIAVNYAARAAGVTRNMRGDEARKLCADLQLVQVPTAHGKADLTLYRDQGKKVLDILACGGVCERSSIDESALDLTERAVQLLAANGGVPPLPVRPGQVHVCGAVEGGVEAWWRRPAECWGPGEALLACGAAIVADLRQQVEEELGYTCSAGIAHSRLLAKLCCGLNKPRQQTVAPANAVPSLLSPLPLAKLRGLGGQFGQQVCCDLNIQTVGQLSGVPLHRLEAAFGEKDARWLFGLARGVDGEEVEQRKQPKSISCGKTFRGGSALTDAAAVHKWLLELGTELEERIAVDKAANNRIPRLLTVSIGVGGAHGAGAVSRSCQLQKATAEAMAADAAALVRRWAAEQGGGWRVSDLYLATSNFAPLTGTTEITRFFKAAEGGDTAAAGEGGDRRESGQQAMPRVAASPVHGDERPGPSGSGAAAVAGSSAGAPAPTLFTDGTPIDEAVLAELPAHIQKEIRDAAAFEAMAVRRQETQQRQRERTQAAQGKRSSRGTVTLVDFLKGKRPKR